MNVPYDSEFAAAVSACARKHAVPICGSGMHDGDLDHGTFVPLHFVNQRLRRLPPGAHRPFRPLGGRPPRRGAVRGGGRPRPGPHVRVPRERRPVPQASGRGPLRLCGGRPRVRPRPGGASGRGRPGRALPLRRGFSPGGRRMRAGFVPDHGRRSGGRARSRTSCCSYEGPFGVGYAVAAFEVEGPRKATPPWPRASTAEAGRATRRRTTWRPSELDGADPYVALARASVEGFVRTGRHDRAPRRAAARARPRRAPACSCRCTKTASCAAASAPSARSRASIADEIVRNGMAAGQRGPALPAGARRTSSTRCRTRWTCCSRPSPSTRRRSWTLHATASS